MVALTERRRHRTHAVRVGKVSVGGGAPIVVQSMTNTDTADISATTGQVIELARASSEIVRITVNNDEAARAVPFIRERLDLSGLHCGERRHDTADKVDVGEELGLFVALDRYASHL